MLFRKCLGHVCSNLRRLLLPILFLTSVLSAQAKQPSQVQAGVLEQLVLLLESEEKLALEIRKRKAGTGRG